MLALLSWAALAAPATRIRHIRIDGVNGPVEDTARAAADSVRGRPALLTRLAPVEAAVERDVRVADAHVSRRFPDTIIVGVVPRVAVLAAGNSNGQLDLVDVEGVRFEAVGRAPEGLPVVRSAGAGPVSDPALHIALNVVAAMPGSLRSRMTDLAVTPAESLTFAVGDTRISWGDASQVDVKARIVSILLRDKPKTIDVSAPDTPVTT
ncbi:MAG: FtsQ-type POTRA domain-containing protein [Tetrasphaera sp.]